MPDFFQLLRGVTIASGGVIPHLHPCLLPDAAKKATKTPTSPTPSKVVNMTSKNKMKTTARKPIGKLKATLPKSPLKKAASKVCN